MAPCKIFFIYLIRSINLASFSDNNLLLFFLQITHSLQTELNRLYEMFCTRNPYFQANGGKVSVVAHSLGKFMFLNRVYY